MLIKISVETRDSDHEVPYAYNPLYREWKVFLLILLNAFLPCRKLFELLNNFIAKLMPFYEGKIVKKSIFFSKILFFVEVKF